MKEQERLDLLIREEDRKLLIEEKDRHCDLLRERLTEAEAALRLSQDEVFLVRRKGGYINPLNGA